MDLVIIDRIIQRYCNPVESVTFGDDIQWRAPAMRCGPSHEEISDRKAEGTKTSN